MPPIVSRVPAATLGDPLLLEASLSVMSVTTNNTEPIRPSLMAVIVVLPSLTPVTSPPADTVAMAGAEEAQVTMRPLSVPPEASRSVGVS